MRLLPLLATVCVALAVAFTAPPQVTAATAGRPAKATAAAVPVPRKARAVDTSHPDRWGTGNPRSGTSRAVVRAVAKGGIIRFRCGPDPIRIEKRRTAKVSIPAAASPSTAAALSPSGGGGGAIFAHGGRLKIVGSRFTRNRCDPRGPDLGGGAVRALSQHDDQPVTVLRSTITDGVCSNGAALSSIGVSWSIFNSVRSSTLRDNPSDGFETDPGIFFLGRDQNVVDSIVK